jgi:hypothetical protein
MIPKHQLTCLSVLLGIVAAAAAQTAPGKTSDLVIQRARSSFDNCRIEAEATLFLCNGDDEIKLWDLSTGTQLYYEHQEKRRFGVSGNDGKYLYKVDETGGVVRENLEHAGQASVPIPPLWPSNKTSVSAAAIDSTGTLVAFGTYKKLVRIENIASQKAMLEIPVDGIPRHLVFSTDGTRLGIQVDNGSIYVVRLDGPSAALESSTITPPEFRRKVKVLSLDYTSQGFVSQRFEDKAWILRNISTGSQTVLTDNGAKGSAAVTPDGGLRAQLVVKSENTYLVLNNSLGATTAELKMPVSISSDSKVLIAPSGKLAIVEGSDDSTYVVEIQTLQRTLLEGAPFHETKVLVFNPHRGFLDITSDTLHIWNMGSGQLAAEGINVGSGSAAASNSGTFITILGSQSLNVLDASSLSVQHFPTDANPEDFPTYLAVGNDGHTLAWSDSKGVRFITNPSDSPSESFCENSNHTSAIALDDNSHYLAILCAPGSVADEFGPGSHATRDLLVVDTHSSKAIVTKQLSLSNSGNEPGGLIFRGDSDLLVADQNGILVFKSDTLELKYLVPTTRKPLEITAGIDLGDLAVSLSDRIQLFRNDKLVHELFVDSPGKPVFGTFLNTHLLAAPSADGFIHVWNLDTWKYQASFVGFSDEDWLAISASGDFDGTDSALNWIGWRLQGSRGLLPLNALFLDFYKPGVLSEILWGSEDSDTSPVKADYDGVRIPGFNALKLNQLAEILHKPDGSGVLCLKSKPSTPLPYFVDGQMSAWDGSDFQYIADSPDCPYRKNLAKAPIETAPPVLSTQWQNERRAPDPQSKLYLVGIAVDNYEFSGDFPTLHSALAGSHEFLDTLNNHDVDSGFAEVIPTELRDPTLADIEKEFSTLAKTLKQEDTLVVFMSGHGLVPAGQDLFFFAPADAHNSSLSDLRHTAISSVKLADYFRRINAQRQLLILDACQSGGALDTLLRIPGPRLVAETALEQIDTLTASKQSRGIGFAMLASTTPFAPAEVGSKGAPSAFVNSIISYLKNNGSTIWTKKLIESVRGSTSNGQQSMFVMVGYDFPMRTVRGAK